MKAFSRGAAPLVSALSLVAVLVPAARLGAQSKDEVPRLLIMPFHSNAKGLGAQAAEEVRQRIATDVSAKQLTVVSKGSVCANLEASGFSCDSAADLVTSRILAKQLRTESYLVGEVDTLPAKKGYRLASVIVITDFLDATQVLPPAVGRSLGDLATQVSKSFQAARKEIPDFTKCMNELRAGNNASAVTAANAAIVAYPQSTAARVCLANALVRLKVAPDSVIRVVSKVLEMDSANKLALGMIADQYDQLATQYKAAGKKDSADLAGQQAVQAWARQIASDPRNVVLVQDNVNKIAASGYASGAKPIITQAVAANPGDPDLVKLLWKILLATHDTADMRQAVAVGDEMVKVDTSAADTTYFIRQAAALAQLGDVKKAAETTTQGINKFPLNPSLWALQSQIQRLAGNPQGAADAAQKLIQIDSTDGHAYLLLAQAQIDLQKADLAVQAIRGALTHHGDPKTARPGAASADSALAGRLLLVLGNQQYKAAKAAQPQRVDDYKRAVTTLAFADSVTASDGAKFVEGLAAFSAGDILVRENQQGKKCDVAKEAQDYFLTAQIKIAAAGKADPKTAQQMLGIIQQYGPAVDGQIKRYCK